MAGQLASLVYRNGYGMMQQVELYEQYPSFAFNDDIMMQTELLFHGPVYAFHEIMADHRRVFDHGESYTAWAHGKNLQWRTYCIFRDIASVIALEGFDASGFHLDLDGCYQSAMRTYLENPTEENKMVVDQFENEIRDTKKIALYRKKAEEEYARQRLPDQADPYRKIADKNTAIARLLYVWMIGNGHGGSVAAALKEKGFHEVVIYGVALLGTRLAEELKHTDISVLYCIDQRKYGLPDEVQTFAMGELEEGVFKIPDAVIVTAFSEFEHIKQSLLEKGFQNVICVDELIYSLLQN
jgi:hypothetical protein